MAKKKELKPKDMTNSEIKIMMKELEMSYEKAKTDVINKIQEMEQLDKKYNQLADELNNRKMF
jgi:hypothetical protein